MLAVLVCISCIWVVKIVTVDMGSAEAENRECKEVIQANPNDPNEAMPNAHFDLGVAYYRTDDRESAINCFDAAISTDPKYWDAYKWLASCYWETNQPLKSIETWKRALRENPDYTWAHVALAFDYKDSGRYEEAIAEWKRLIELEPDIAGLHVLLGDAYTEAGHFKEGILAYNHGLKLNPNHSQAHLGLAKVYLKMGNRDLALEEYEILKAQDEELAQELLDLIHQ